MPPAVLPNEAPLPTPPFPHLCPACTYDLRAHSSGSQCPECGTLSPNGYIELRGFASNKMSEGWFGSFFCLYLVSHRGTSPTFFFTLAVTCTSVFAAISYALRHFAPHTHAIRIYPDRLEFSESPHNFIKPLVEHFVPDDQFSLTRRFGYTVIHFGQSRRTKLYLRLSPESAEQLQAYLSHASSVNRAFPELLVTRKCSACHHAAPITERRCSRCSADIAHVPAILSQYIPPRTRNRWLYQHAVFGLFTCTFVLMSLFLLSGNVTGLLLLACGGVLLALFNGYWKSDPEPVDQFRFCPAGYQFAPSDKPIKLEPWPPGAELSFQYRSFGIRTLRLRNRYQLTFDEGHDIALDTPTCQLLQYLVREWSDAPAENE